MNACRKENKLRFVLLLEQPAATFTWNKKDPNLKAECFTSDTVCVFGSVNHLGSCTKNFL